MRFLLSLLLAPTLLFAAPDPKLPPKKAPVKVLAETRSLPVQVTVRSGQERVIRSADELVIAMQGGPADATAPHRSEALAQATRAFGVVMDLNKHMIVTVSCGGSDQDNLEVVDVRRSDDGLSVVVQWRRTHPKHGTDKKGPVHTVALLLEHAPVTFKQLPPVVVDRPYIEGFGPLP